MNGMISVLDTIGGIGERYIYLRSRYVPMAPIRVARLPNIMSRRAHTQTSPKVQKHDEVYLRFAGPLTTSALSVVCSLLMAAQPLSVRYVGNRARAFPQNADTPRHAAAYILKPYSMQQQYTTKFRKGA